MTISQLSYFISVAETLSFTKTAALMHVSQPAVSSAIRDLEKEFSIVLFKRTSGNLTLTADGAEFSLKAKELMNHYNLFRQEMTSRALSQAIPACSLGVTGLLSYHYLPGLYRYFQENCPSLHIDAREDSVANLKRHLKSGLLDVICISTDQPDPEFHSLQVAPMEIRAYAHRDLFYREQQTISIPDLADIPLAVFRPGSTHNALIRHAFEKEELVPNIVFEVSQIRTLEELTAQKMAVSFLPPFFFTDSEQVLSYHLPGLFNGSTFLLWNQETPQVRKFLRTAKAFFRVCQNREITACHR